MGRFRTVVSEFWNDIRAQKLRTTLTILGITWGTVAVIVLLAFGTGLERAASAFDELQQAGLAQGGDGLIGILDARQLHDNAPLPLQLNLGMYIRQQMPWWFTSEAFKRSCEEAAQEEGLDASNPPMVIIKKIWRHLKATHRLRIVK